MRLSRRPRLEVVPINSRTRWFCWLGFSRGGRRRFSSRGLLHANRPAGRPATRERSHDHSRALARDEVFAPVRFSRVGSVGKKWGGSARVRFKERKIADDEIELSRDSRHGARRHWPLARERNVSTGRTALNPWVPGIRSQSLDKKRARASASFSRSLFSLASLPSLANRAPWTHPPLAFLRREPGDESLATT